MASQVGIANLALSHVGSGHRIVNLDTENSEEAAAINEVYDLAVQEILRDFPWPFATKIAALALVTDDEDDDHPTEEWAYSYRYPSDCLAFKKIQSGARADSSETATRYRIARDASGKLIFSDESDAIGEYTLDVDDAQEFAPDYVFALSYRIAAHIAPRLAKGDRNQVATFCLQMYGMYLSKARANAINEERRDPEPLNEFLAGR